MDSIAEQLVRLAKHVLGARKSPSELRKMDKYNRKNRQDINEDMRDLREENPDKYKRPGGVSGERRNR